MMNRDGTIRAMTAPAIAALRNTGTTRDIGPRAAIRVYRDIEGLDERIWQHLLDCAARLMHEEIKREQARMDMEDKLRDQIANGQDIDPAID